MLRDDIDVVNLCFCNQKTTFCKFSPDKIFFVDYCSNRNMLHYVYVYLFNSREVIFDMVYSIRNTDCSSNINLIAGDKYKYFSNFSS